MEETLSTALRSGMVGALRAADEGDDVVLAGWVHRRRDLGGLFFLDLRDRSGLVQLSIGPDWTEEESFREARSLGAEDVIRVEGTVELRPDDARNPELATGDVEVHVERLRRLSRAETPAIPVYRGPDEDLPAEERRLRYRHLDLRREELQANLLLRHRLALETRSYFDALGFVEVETPILTKPTPEGARDYLVPSRVHPGEFYALPQSPQIYKQLLMAGGFDRYFQIARCFRDEDLRADRQPEFTQIDVEASFIDEDDMLGWIEGLMARLAEAAGIDVPELPLGRIPHREAMERFGSDRPDLRNPLEIEDWSEPLGSLEMNILRNAVDEGGRVRGIRLPEGAALSRREIDALAGEAAKGGAPGLLWLRRDDDGEAGPLSRFMTDGAREAVGIRPGDLLVAAAGPDRITSPSLGRVRLAAADALDLPPATRHAWTWITDFPLFEESAEGGVTPSNHPFVRPRTGDVERLESEPLAVRAIHYDLIYNGVELGGGSLRVHEPELQRRIFRALDLDDDEMEAKFGHLLEALASGTPPHGGIALGLDRIVMLFGGAGSLRDVIAFPKTTAARALFEGAPTPVGDADLAELGLRVDDDGGGG